MSSSAPPSSRCMHRCAAPGSPGISSGPGWCWGCPGQGRHMDSVQGAPAGSRALGGGLQHHGALQSLVMERGSSMPACKEGLCGALGRGEQITPQGNGGAERSQLPSTPAAPGFRSDEFSITQREEHFRAAFAFSIFSVIKASRSIMALAASTSVPGVAGKEQGRILVAVPTSPPPCPLPGTHPLFPRSSGPALQRALTQLAARTVTVTPGGSGVWAAPCAQPCLPHCPRSPAPHSQITCPTLPAHLPLLPFALLLTPEALDVLLLLSQGLVPELLLYTDLGSCLGHEFLEQNKGKSCCQVSWRFLQIGC